MGFFLELFEQNGLKLRIGAAELQIFVIWTQNQSEKEGVMNRTGKNAKMKFPWNIVKNVFFLQIFRLFFVCKKKTEISI